MLIWRLSCACDSTFAEILMPFHGIFIDLSSKRCWKEKHINLDMRYMQLNWRIFILLRNNLKITVYKIIYEYVCIYKYLRFYFPLLNLGRQFMLLIRRVRPQCVFNCGHQFLKYFQLNTPKSIVFQTAGSNCTKKKMCTLSYCIIDWAEFAFYFIYIFVYFFRKT